MCAVSFDYLISAGGVGRSFIYPDRAAKSPQIPHYFGPGLWPEGHTGGRIGGRPRRDARDAASATKSNVSLSHALASHASHWVEGRSCRAELRSTNGRTGTAPAACRIFTSRNRLPLGLSPGVLRARGRQPWWRAGLHRLQGGEVNGAQQGSRSHQERRVPDRGRLSGAADRQGRGLAPVKYGQEVPSLAEIIRRIEAAKKKIDLLRQVMRK